jgi:hypothetical protein
MTSQALTTSEDSSNLVPACLPTYLPTYLRTNQGVDVDVNELAIS